VCEVDPSFEKKIAESSIFAFAVVPVAVAEKRMMAMTAEAMMMEVEGRDEGMEDDVSASTIDVSAATIDAGL
jgi:hypothetical protein